MKKIFFVFLFVFIFLAPTSVLFATSNQSTTGFVSGNIWYSQAKLTEGDDVKIYTGFWNGESSAVSIKVSFFDGETLLGERAVQVPALTLKEISIPWKVTVGDHEIRAIITKATSNAGGTNESIALSTSEVKSGSMFIPKKIGAEIGEEKLGELGEKVIDVLPENVSEPITKSINDIDLFRQKTEMSIEDGIQDAKNKIKEIDEAPKNTDTNDTKSTDSKTINQSKKDSLDSTEKPIAYIQLFLLSIASFIFSHSLVFYGLIILIIFFIIRFIYRKIRGR